MKAGKKVNLAPVDATLAPGNHTKLKLEPAGKKAAKTILKRLKRGTRAKAALTVTLTDPAGNSITSNPKVTLTR